MDDELIFDSADVEYFQSSTMHLLLNCSTDCKLAFREYCALVLRNRSSKKRIFEWMHQLFARLANLTHESDIHNHLTVIPSMDDLEKYFIPCSVFVSNLKKLTAYWEECSYDELYSLVLLLDNDKDGYICWNDHMTFVMKLEGCMKQRRPSHSLKGSNSNSSLHNLGGSGGNSPDANLRRSSSGASLASGNMMTPPVFRPVNNFNSTGGTDSSNNSRSSTPSYGASHSRTGSGAKSPSLTILSGSHGSPLSPPTININQSSGYDTLYSELRDQQFNQDGEFYSRYMAQASDNRAVVTHDVGNRLSSVVQIFLLNQHSDVVNGLVGSSGHMYEPFSAEKTTGVGGSKFSPMRSIMKEATKNCPQKHGSLSALKKPVPLAPVSAEYVCRLLLRIGGDVCPELHEQLDEVRRASATKEPDSVPEVEPVHNRNPSFINYECPPMPATNEHDPSGPIDADNDHSTVYSISTADTSVNTSNISGVNSRHSRVYSSVSEGSVDGDGDGEMASPAVQSATEDTSSFMYKKRQQQHALLALNAKNEAQSAQAQSLLRKRGVAPSASGAQPGKSTPTQSSPNPVYDASRDFGNGRTDLSPAGASFPIPSVIYTSPSQEQGGGLPDAEESDDDINENDISGISTDDSIGRAQGLRRGVGDSRLKHAHAKSATTVSSPGVGRNRQTVPTPFSPFQRRPNSPSFAARRFSTTGKNIPDASTTASPGVGRDTGSAGSSLRASVDQPSAAPAGQNKLVSAVEVLRKNINSLTEEMVNQQADISNDKALLVQVEHLLEGLKTQRTASGTVSTVSSIFPEVETETGPAVSGTQLSSDSVISADESSVPVTVATSIVSASEGSVLESSCFLTQQSPEKVKMGAPEDNNKVVGDSAPASTIDEESQAQSMDVDGGGFFLTQEAQFHAPKQDPTTDSDGKRPQQGVPTTINMKIGRRASRDHSVLQSDNISTMSYTSGVEGVDAYDYGYGHHAYRAEQPSINTSRSYQHGRNHSVGNASVAMSSNVNTSNVSHIKAHIFRSPGPRQVSTNKNEYSRAACAWKPKPTAKSNKYNDRFTDVALTNHIRKMNSVLYR